MDQGPSPALDVRELCERAEYAAQRLSPQRDGIQLVSRLVGQEISVSPRTRTRKRTATVTGWTYLEIDQLTLWDISELFDYWQDYPPIHVLVSAYLMGDRGSVRKDPKRQHSDFAELSRAVALAGGGVLGKLPEFYKGMARTIGRS